MNPEPPEPSEALSRHLRGGNRGPAQLCAQQIDELVIAYNVNLPSWDPTVGRRR